MGVLRVQPWSQDIIMRPWQVSGRLIQLAYLSIDVLCILIGSFLVFYVRFAPDVLQQSLLYLEWPSLPSYPFLPYYASFLLLYIVLIVLFLKTMTFTAHLEKGYGKTKPSWCLRGFRLQH